MKKSKVKIEEFLKDVNNVLDLVSKVDSLDPEKTDINKLGVRIENGEKNSITNYKLNLMDLNEEQISIPPAAFESIITLPSSDFQKICRDMSNLSDTIEIKSVGSNLIFSCSGNFASQETIIGQTSSGLAFVKNADNTDIIQGYYNLKHLVLMLHPFFEYV